MVLCISIESFYGKQLKIYEFYGSIGKIFDVSFLFCVLERRHKWENRSVVKN